MEPLIKRLNLFVVTRWIFSWNLNQPYFFVRYNRNIIVRSELNFIYIICVWVYPYLKCCISDEAERKSIHISLKNNETHLWRAGLPFGHFLKLKKIVPFKACFGKIWAKLNIFGKIKKKLSCFSKLSLNIWPLFGLYLAFIWPLFGLYLAFFHFWGFGPFWNCLWPNIAFFGPGNPGGKYLSRCSPFPLRSVFDRANPMKQILS